MLNQLEDLMTKTYYQNLREHLKENTNILNNYAKQNDLNVNAKTTNVIYISIISKDNGD